MNNTLYDLQYFIDKFTGIDKLIVGTLYRDGDTCALGACGVRVNNTNKPNEETKALVKLITENQSEKFKLATGTYKNNTSVVWILNDDERNRFIKGSTPKERILNALMKIKNGEKI